MDCPNCGEELDIEESGISTGAGIQPGYIEYGSECGYEKRRHRGVGEEIVDGSVKSLRF